MIRVILLLCLLSCAVSQVLGQTTGRADEYGQLPLYADFDLSADGDQAVALRAIGDTYQVVLLDFRSGTSKLLMAADSENFLYNWCTFANRTRVVCSIRSYIVLRAGQIGAGYRSYRDGRTVVTRMIAVDTDGSNQLQLIPQAKTRIGGKLVWNATDQDDVINWLPDDERHILIQLAREDRLKPSVYRLNIYNNKLKKTQTFLQTVWRWYADDNGDLRFAAGYESPGTPVAYAVNRKKRTPLDITHLGGVDEPRVVNVGSEGEAGWVIANHGKNTKGVHKVSLATGEVLETLHEDTRYDMSRLWLDPSSRKPIAVSYEAERQRIVWFDEKREQQFAALRSAAGNPDRLTVMASDRKGRKFVVKTEGNGTIPSYYLYDVEAPAISSLGSDEIGRAVPLQAVTYSSRDGLEIPAYLALPGPRESGPYPTVIMPHGGPWARTTDGYWFITQFLVNSGYAVLQPNFRGSSGYGDRYLSAGFRQWGEAMQEDVIDGLNYLEREGIAAKGRSCIVGGSYGGYVALVAAYKTPDRFRCAVSFAGVTDLAELKSRWFNYVFGRLAIARIQDGPQMSLNSPIENVDAIDIPVLLVHGDVDTSVMVEQSGLFAEALAKAGKDHRYVEQANGDHFFSLQSHRIEYLTELGSFLSEHIGSQ